MEFFVYFNIKPLKETLDKQEGIIGDLKAEALDLLNQSTKQTQDTLEKFKEDQSSSLFATLKQQKDTISLEVSNKIQSAESAMLEKIDSISSEKDSKLKEILLSEMSNKVLSLEKNLTAVIEEYKKIMMKNLRYLKTKPKLI